MTPKWKKLWFGERSTEDWLRLVFYNVLVAGVLSALLKSCSY